jgi:hypothetical protein
VCPARKFNRHSFKGVSKTMRYFAIAILAAACGSTTGIPGDGQTSCLATISGAVTAANVTCFAAAGVDSSGNGAIGFTFEGLTGYSVVTGIDTTGTPTTTTYTNTNSLKGACEVVNTTNSQAWVAAHNASTPDQGTFSMTLSSLGSEFAADGGEAFLNVHGSVNCSMPPVTGTNSTGTVTLSATF